jgi:hypothetical protein
MDHNLIPPFMLREDDVNETPIMIHFPNPDISDHSIYFEQAKLQTIPFALWGIFS